MSVGQYLRDTQAELRHVAWPTRLQTIVYTALVAFLSVGIALYLGLFDYLFTTGLARFLEVLPAAPIAETQTTSSSSPVLKLDSISTSSTATSSPVPVQVPPTPAAPAPAPAPSFKDILKI